MSGKSVLLATVALYAAVELAAATTIRVNSVAQRWPWNNKADIRYTITGGEDLSSSSFHKVVFTAVIEGVTNTIEGSSIGASAKEGTHTVTWELPSGIKSETCTMSATIGEAAFPSGNDYMIVNLVNGSVHYEGLYATQEASNERYNTDAYKEDLLVLRKVPAGGTYPTGNNTFYANANSAKTWTTDRDYYIGVFPVTQYQYRKITGTNPSIHQSTIAGNNANHRPVDYVSWTNLRGTASPTNALVPSATGTFLQRLNHLSQTASGLSGFDLPTELMFEIAERAETNAVYFWGTEISTDYLVCKDNTSGQSTVATGTTSLPNRWGLYDMAGNVNQWCLDDTSLANLANAPDPFTPAYGGSATQRQLRCGNFNTATTDATYSVRFRASCRFSSSAGALNKGIGFRVAIVAR